MAGILAVAAGRSVQRGEGPAKGDLVTAHSESDPSVEFNLLIIESNAPGEWVAEVFAIGCGLESLATFDGVDLGDHVQISLEEISGIIRHTSAQ
ncbi:hypothetical protein [Cupriavidus sp. CuC1]|uniref:hypothetical protein n=1 Tax=Cupriavidus sp. CuC1 TaxID=3373131 RepID=UPI0037D28B8E